MLSYLSMATTLLGLFASMSTMTTVRGLEVGDPVCVEGFIMDFFCIQRGTLLDAPSVVTLEEPDRHSVHCLIDVPSCVNSPFEVLLDPNANSDGLFRRGFRVDEAGQQMLIDLAKEIGSCTECDGTGDQTHGFRAAVRGTILTKATDDTPPVIAVEAVLNDTAEKLCSAPSAPAPAPTVSDPSTGIKLGDNVCVEGFIMDFFCIQRGTLLDAPSIVTLEEPDQHSVHCLIDVPSCVNSPFEILLDPNDASDGLYRRGWRVDPEGQQMLIDLAKRIGSCTDCDGTGDLIRGMRAAVRGSVIELATGDVPPVIKVDSVLDGTAEALCAPPAVGEPTGELTVGLPVCVDGFVMDFFCIQRGTLLDAPSIVTLEQPDQHSVHCLIDVPSCVNSPFEILLDPNDGSDGLYRRGWRVDEAGQEMLITLAKEVGSCSECDGNGDLIRGMKAAVRGRILTLAEGDVPPVIAVEEVHFGTAEELCSGGGEFQIVTGDDVDFVVASSDTTFQSTAYLHGSLMLISWGWLLPMGAIFAKFFKHRPNGLWFQIHRGLQTFGLLLATIGWFIALTQFTSLQDKGLNNYRHGLLGCVTMGLGLLQPLNAIIRPHPPKDGEEKAPARAAWEVAHKGLGYCALLLAVATIGYGTTLLPDPDVQRTFQMAYAIGVGATIVALVGALMADKGSYKPPADAAPEEPQEKPLKHGDDDEA